MPKKYFRRKRRYAKKSFKKAVRSVISKQSETKFYVYANSQSVSTSGYIQDMFATLVQGDDNSARNGRKIFVKWIHINFTIQAADTVNYIRLGIYKYLRGRASTATDGFPSNILGWHDPIRVSKVRDRLVKGMANTAPTTDTLKIVRFKIPVFKKFYFTGTGNDTATSPYYIQIMTDSAAVSHPTIAWEYRVSFTDM